MNKYLIITIVILTILTLVVVMIGIFGLLKKKTDKGFTTKMMMLRIILQVTVVALVALAVFMLK